MKHGRSHHANVLDTEAPTLAETASSDDNCYVIRDVFPDLPDELFPCFKSNRRGPRMLGRMSEFFWKFQGDCDGLVILHVNGIDRSGHVFYQFTIL